MRIIPCIVCPQYCSIEVRTDGEDSPVVTGYECKRGKAYAEAELTQPMRTLTTSIPIQGGTHKMVSVRTSAPIPPGSFLMALDEIKRTVVRAPIYVGDCLVNDLCGTGAKVLATRKVNGEK